MTFGLGRAEILSAQANGMTLLVLALLIVYGAIRHLISPPARARLAGADRGAGRGRGQPRDHADRSAGTATTTATRHDHGTTTTDGHDHDHEAPKNRSLNVEGSYQHILTDLFGFIATAMAAVVIIATGFDRADAIASLLIAAIMLHAAYGLLRASVRVIMEAAPEGIDPDAIGRTLAAQPGVAEVHDLHIWEVTSGFPAISAHVVVDAGHDCHEVRRELSRLLDSTLRAQPTQRFRSSTRAPRSRRCRSR